MVFSKSFPRTIEGVSYPKWEEVFLSIEEEEKAEKNARDENITLMKECINDAKSIFQINELKEYQSDIITTAIALFEKRASHVVFHKDTIAKEKFDTKK